jgi:hypothetical protein
VTARGAKKLKNSKNVYVTHFLLNVKKDIHVPFTPKGSAFGVSRNMMYTYTGNGTGTGTQPKSVFGENLLILSLSNIHFKFKPSSAAQSSKTRRK